MSALQSLFREHRIITQLSNAFESYIDGLEQQGAASREHLGLFAVAYRDLVDLIHHEKEETVLMPFLVQHGFDWDNGTLPEVRREHRQERYLTGVLQHASTQLHDWSEEDERHIAATGRAIVEFQREHLIKENTELFPAVLARLSDAELAELKTQLDDFDKESRTEKQGAALEELIASLLESYPAPTWETPDASPYAGESAVA